MEFCEIIAEVDAEQLRWEEQVVTRGEPREYSIPLEPTPEQVGRIARHPIDTSCWFRNMRPYADGEPQTYVPFFDDICRAWEDALSSLE